MANIWKYFSEQCDFCGSDSEILTEEHLEEGWGYDGDDIRCTECGAKGYWSVDCDGNPYCNWIE